MESPVVAVQPGEDARLHSYWELVERIAASRHLQPSARLRDFLFYVAGCALKGAGAEATEQQIGIHVFNRPPGYNSSEDSIVRTHARLLRQKLEEYFRNEGAQEETIIEIPKGHYVPVFLPRVQPSPPAPPVELPLATNRQDRPPRTVRWLWLALAATLIALAAVLLWWKIHPRPLLATSDDIDRFWGPFFANNSSLVIYSNALFVGDPTTGLRYAEFPADTSRDTSKVYFDTYTGIGEVDSVYELTRLFDSRNATFKLKRSQLVTWDEAKDKNLIFIGSARENPALLVLPGTVDFTLAVGTSSPVIVNHHPRPGEQETYSRPEHPLTKEYAIVALVPGLEPGQKALLFSGSGTLGTQAALEFTCHPDSLDQLLRAVSGPGGSVRPFEAVIETTLGGEVPIQSRIVALRVH
jgi:hypothetical protein